MRTKDLADAEALETLLIAEPSGGTILFPERLTFLLPFFYLLPLCGILSLSLAWWAYRASSENSSSINAASGLTGGVVAGAAVAVILNHFWDPHPGPLSAIFVFLCVVIGELGGGLIGLLFSLISGRSQHVHRALVPGVITAFNLMGALVITVWYLFQR